MGKTCPLQVPGCGISGGRSAECRPMAHCFALPPRGYRFLTPGPTVGVVVVGSLCASTGTQPNSTDSAASVRPACSVGVGLGNKVLLLPPEELPVCRERGKSLYLKRAIKCHQLCLHKDSAIVCSGGGSVGDLKSSGSVHRARWPGGPRGQGLQLPILSWFPQAKGPLGSQRASVLAFD